MGDVLDRVRRKKLVARHAQIAQAQREAGTRQALRFADGQGGYVGMMVPPYDYHVFGDMFGYECWQDPGFQRDYLRAFPECRVRTAPACPTLIVQGNAARAVKFQKTYTA